MAPQSHIRRLIADGVVDERSICDVRPDDIAPYTQVHLFAGIGGWSYAARLAGWPDDRPLWTGSCPCQPFSSIGNRVGFADKRHLWPEMFRLVRECRPPIIFGEQVARALVWLDLVLGDLESANYACGAFNIPAAGKGARHERQRIWFIADADAARWSNAERIATAEKETELRRSIGLDNCHAIEPIHGSFEPDDSWIVDGLSDRGYALRALGNAIVPQVAAEVIRAYMSDC